MTKYDLEDRLASFVGQVLTITKKIKCDTSGEYLSNQIGKLSAVPL